MADTPLYLRIRDNIRKAFVFTPWPLNSKGRPVMAFIANVLFQENPNPAIFEVIPDGATTNTAVETEGLQGVTNQDNKTSDWLETGGYAMDSSPAPVLPTGIAVVSPLSVPYYNQGEVVKKILGELSWEEVKAYLDIKTPVTPTAPPDTWGEPVHYESMSSGSTDPIYASVETGDFVPSDTPIPVVANPQADVTITAAGDQTITLAENEFTVVGGTKTLILKGYNPDTNTIYNLPEGITFNPDTRVITISETQANITLTLRVTCLDILTQANWDDFVLTVNRSIAANTVAYVQARFIPNYFGAGPNNDLFEVQMMDGYADSPMYYDVLLASASPPTTHGLNFERPVLGVGKIRRFQLASGQNLKNKSLKIYISRLDSGAGDIGIYNFTTGTTSTGFITL